MGRFHQRKKINEVSDLREVTGWVLGNFWTGHFRLAISLWDVRRTTSIKSMLNVSDKMINLTGHGAFE